MNYLARTTDGRPLLGDNSGFVSLEAAHPSLASVRDALPRATAGALDGPVDATAERIPSTGFSFGSPLAEFAKLWGIGLNYIDHAGDLDEERPTEPASFMKPETALTGPNSQIRLPPTDHSERVTAEAELAVVIGRECYNIDLENVDDVIAGFVPVIDMTAEDILQRNPRFLTRAKSYDTFLVVGPLITMPDSGFDLHNLTVTTSINGETKAENEIGNMQFSPREIVSFHSEVMTLQPGDLLSTGTPGAAPIKVGDTVRATVESIGSVEVPVTR